MNYNSAQEAKYLAGDAERKYEEVARKLNMMENDLEKALVKADSSENKIIDLEMELKVVGDNMKCMEVCGDQSGPLSLVEECRGSALIGRELHSVEIFLW